ncbi:DUF1127 domain-containing protein [Pseudomonas cichorii]|uniref:DUF1127 domain-containing protein n=1 Tax=Pseudomonas lijiangensis TaxID=2995658 RepID=A0ABX8HSD8_9PSED|nr:MULTISPECIES: DUF1127 domain-containing protein [Pseudomonas syringae group]MBX8492126.1 DUF1127 domain-containing protein [Pseudomonas cichorii]MBX8502509.1 DUF1127 domain-containing protein [Pseudomonas lijiangensis]MBX8507457.1 DUF1127 domain-containing protein [Pseudomonas lijiangensis]MBX8512273.1 DUF1127 domain-containing protein [Pseudomonas cichorii]MBX8521202.1 DUF1127 domain-containing protein [Pseudomonas cichorii]
MNGLSDVRLALHSHELQEKSLAGNASANSQPCMSRWALYRHRWTTRHALLKLTEDQLRDIGLDAGQAMAEAMKPFWRM